MKASVGRIVYYTLTQHDADAINVRREHYRVFCSTLVGQPLPGEPGMNGHMAHVGKLNQLRNDGDGVNRMMSIGLHSRFSGRPSRSDGLARFIDYAQGLGDVWFARRIDIATTFRDQYPAEKALAEMAADLP